MPPKAQSAAKGIVAKKDSGFRAQLKREGKYVYGPTRRGSNAEADAERDRQTLREENVSMSSLVAAAAQLNDAAAAARTLEKVKEEVNERRWSKRYSVEVTDVDESGASQLTSSNISSPAGAAGQTKRLHRQSGCKRLVTQTSGDLHPTGQAVADQPSDDLHLADTAGAKASAVVMATIKVIRTSLKPDGVAQPDATADRQTNLAIVHASDQPFDQAPTQETVNLVNFLKDTTNDTSCILPAALHTIRESSCYNLEVLYPSGSGGLDFIMPCQKVIALVMSTDKSVPDPSVKIV